MNKNFDPKVSIIIPVYNCHDYVYKCLDSVIHQTYENIQIIVVDDGSDDGSSRIIDDFSDSKFIVIHQENTGVCVARNNGIKAADGDFLTFVDGDDYLDPDYIEKMVSEALEYNSELVISGFIFEQVNGTRKNLIMPGQYLTKTNEMWAYRLSSTCGRLYRKSFWDKYGILFTTETSARAEDVPICLFSNYTAKSIRVLHYAGYHYIQHDGSAMHQFIGLKKYGFPYEAMDWLAQKSTEVEHHNSKEYFDVGIIKFFAHFWFYMGRGADRVVKNRMLDYFKDYVRRICPDYRSSWKSVNRRSKLPITIWGAIQLFIWRLSIG